MFNYVCLISFNQVYGQGFQPMGSKTSFRIQSSINNIVPIDWAPVKNQTLPVHMQLERDIYSTQQRYVEVRLPYPMIVSGMYIETLR